MKKEVKHRARNERKKSLTRKCTSEKNEINGTNKEV
jgi:hypothetical protein